MYQLFEDNYYHIYNHANGSDNLFVEGKNFTFFLEKYQLYLSPFVSTLAYCLMPNHFHLLVRIKNLKEIQAYLAALKSDLHEEQTFPSAGQTFPAAGQTFPKFETLEKLKQVEQLKQVEKLEEIKSLNPLLVSKQFAKLFSCYTQSFNKVYNRKGSLFLKNFKRKPIITGEYLQNAINYIHFNPIHHGFESNPSNWDYSSFNPIVSGKETFLDREEVTQIFGDLDNFIFCHQYPVKMDHDEF